MPTVHYNDVTNHLFIVWETSADMPSSIYKKALDKGLICNYGNYENAIIVELD